MRARVRSLVGVYFVLTAAVLSDHAHAGPFTVELHEVRDTRPSRDAGILELEVKITGSDIAEVTKTNVIVSDAADDLGANLWELQRPRNKLIIENRNGERTALYTTIQLKPSARKAATLVRCVGTIDLLVPTADPAADVTVNLIKNDGRPVQSATLEQAGVGVTPRLSAKYGAWRKVELARNPPKATPAPATPVPEPQFPLRRPPGPPLEIDAKSVAFEIFDPLQRLAAITFWQGDERVRQSYSRSYSDLKELRIIELPTPIVPATRATFTLITEKAMVHVPFEFKDVPLP